MSAVTVNWKTCTDDSCFGVRLDKSGKCLAHASADEFDAALTAIGRDGNVDARGVEVSGERLQRVLDVLPRDPDGHPRFGQADFRGAAFKGDARFDDATFQGDAHFEKATFPEQALFHRASFHESADFTGVEFGGFAGFSLSNFAKPAAFEKAIFSGTAWFYGATFQMGADFSKAAFQADAMFEEATFKRENFLLGENAKFVGAVFEQNAWFRLAWFEDSAWFDQSIFQRAQTFGPALALQALRFADCRFLEKADLDLVADRLTLSRAKFPRGANIRVRWAEIDLEKTEFGEASILAGSSEFGFNESKLAERTRTSIEHKLRGLVRSERPRLLSMRLPMWRT